MRKTNHTKLADDVSFEQNFFQLAFAYIRDKVPNLLNYMLGFEVVNKNEEGTQAVGLFKFDVSGRQLYIPVFYKNGELKGADLLYNQNQDTFVPNKENWIDAILNSSPEELGGEASSSRQDIMLGGVGNPDLSKVYNPTRGTKLGFSKMASINTDHTWSFPEFLKQADCRMATTYANTLMQHPELHKLAVAAYGPEFYDALQGCKQASVTVTPTEVPEVEVVLSGSPEALVQGLSDGEKADLINDGVVIKDNRKDGARIPYKIQHPMSLGAAPAAGIYDVLMRGGKFINAAVIPSINNECCYASDDNASKTILIPITGTDTLPAAVASTKVLVNYTLDGAADFKGFIANLPVATKATGQMDSNTNYSAKRPHCIFIEADGSMASSVFELHSPVISEDTYTFKIYGGGGHVNTVIVSPAYKRMRVVDDTLYVPATAKVKKFSARSYYHKDIPLGDHRDVDAKIKGLFDEVKVSYDRSGYKVINNGRVLGYDLSRGAALVTLVTKVGLALAPAKTAVAEAANYTPVKLALAKQAQLYDPGQVAFPGMPPMPGGMNGQLGVPEQYPQSETVNVMQGADSNIQNKRIMDSLTGMGQGMGQNTLPQQSVDAIMQSAQSGDRDVFDVANISQLINRSDIDTPLDQYMSDLQLSLDRLGRIYFLMLYHGDKFAERFSQEDLPAMEESVRNTFLNLGELILKLKERKIESDSGSAVETDLNQLV